MKRTLILTLAAAVVFVSACEGDDPPVYNSSDGGDDHRDAGGDGSVPNTDGGLDIHDTAAEDDAGEGTGGIEIYLAGDNGPVEFDDDLAGQTPSNFRVAISAYDVLTSADAEPIRCFDHGTDPVIVDLSGDNLAGVCDDLPTGGYTHGRTRVDWATYAVEGTLHFGGAPYPGDITFFRAYSDTTYEGESYSSGEGWMTYAGVTDVTIPLDFSNAATPAGIVTELDADGGYWMKFPYTRPLPVIAGAEDDQWARFNWVVTESFRWRDSNGDGYTGGVWDMVAAGAEEVVVPGVSSYHVTSSID